MCGALLFVVLLTSCGATRAAAGEAERIAEVLELEAGMRVADVGAGDGRWSEALARYVGDTGHVFATEVDEDELEKIRERVIEEGLANVTPVLADQRETGLGQGCCDAIVLRMVYHHFVDPSRMRAGLRRALRPQGLLAVIDIEPQRHWRRLPGVPDRGGHGIEPEDLVAEMTADGFEVVTRYPEWDDKKDRFCIVFRHASEASP